jgi:Na+/proline symporter
MLVRRVLTYAGAMALMLCLAAAIIFAGVGDYNQHPDGTYIATDGR